MHDIKVDLKWSEELQSYIKIPDFEELNKQCFGTFEQAQERAHKLIIEEAAREKPKRMLRPCNENC